LILSVSFRIASQIVRCCSIQRAIIIESCTKSADRNEFHFTHDDQKVYLRSLAVYYLGRVVDINGTQTEAVIAIDSDIDGFFKVSVENILDRVMQEFGLRFRLEMALQTFLKGTGV